jgi:hypothetical protein
LFRAIADSPGANWDEIFDFAAGDKVDLSAIDANSTLAGNQAFSFIGAGGFHGVAGELRINVSSIAWFIAGDVNGDGFVDLNIKVNMQLQQGDFVL